MARQTVEMAPTETMTQLVSDNVPVNIGVNPPKTIAVKTSFDKSKKYFAIVSRVTLSLSLTSSFAFCCSLQFPISFSL